MINYKILHIKSVRSAYLVKVRFCFIFWITHSIHDNLNDAEKTIRLLIVNKNKIEKKVVREY